MDVVTGHRRLGRRRCRRHSRRAGDPRPHRPAPGGSLFDAMLAETLLARGDAEMARATIDGALAFVDETGEAFHLAALHRLRAACFQSIPRNPAPS